METEDRGLIETWMGRWSELVEFEVWEVGASRDGAPAGR
jgi:hypothetical protein